MFLMSDIYWFIVDFFWIIPAAIGAILVLALLIWVDYLIAREFYRAACAKGFEQKKYLWLPFFLGVVGYLLVIALPSLPSDRRGRTDAGAGPEKAAAKPKQPDAADPRVKKLKRLSSEGLITEEEYKKALAEGKK